MSEPSTPPREREFPRGMSTSEATAAVIECASAYIDQLNSFNALAHPEVHKQRLRLNEAVDAYHHASPYADKDE